MGAPTIETIPGVVVWFTGLSGAGKTTLADALAGHLRHCGRPVFVLDGDVLRTGLCSDLGFGAKDREENIRRAGEVARLCAQTGIIVIAAFISPFRADRDRVRGILPRGRFLEVFVNSPLEVCEKRDVKGLYRRARSGSIPEFTGISSPYEPPLSPELELRTDRSTVSDCVCRIAELIDQSCESRKIIPVSTECGGWAQLEGDIASAGTFRAMA
ncbi:MAG: adenylyl-sulfate kinase [Pedosphaera sp.]|nr:adenylyl-sulfate kinase [Pedosphaera sp.]